VEDTPICPVKRDTITCDAVQPTNSKKGQNPVRNMKEVPSAVTEHKGGKTLLSITRKKFGNLEYIYIYIYIGCLFSQVRMPKS
jgi:hypothetical protein